VLSLPVEQLNNNREQKIIAFAQTPSHRLSSVHLHDFKAIINTVLLQSVEPLRKILRETLRYNFETRQ